MRIGFIFSGVFWGILLILFGVSAILRSYNINIPFVRIIIGLIIIYIGIVILTGEPIIYSNNNITLFNNIDIKITDNINNEYNIIFGRGTIDLTDIEPQRSEEIEINTIFGSSLIKIDSQKPIKLKVSSALGSARIPDGNKITFGDYKYYSNNYQQGDKVAEVEISVVFGSVEIIDINK